MSCVGDWNSFVLIRRDGTTVDFNRKIRIASVDPANHIISVVVLDNAGNPIQNTRRRGTCFPISGDQSVLSIIIRTNNRNLPVSGVVFPESTSPSSFSGTYVTDPDTGDTGTGLGSQTTTFIRAGTSLIADTLAAEGEGSTADEGTGEATKRRGGAKKGKK